MFDHTIALMGKCYPELLSCLDIDNSVILHSLVSNLLPEHHNNNHMYTIQLAMVGTNPSLWPYKRKKRQFCSYSQQNLYLIPRGKISIIIAIKNVHQICLRRTEWSQNRNFNAPLQLCLATYKLCTTHT